MDTRNDNKPDRTGAMVLILIAVGLIIVGLAIAYEYFIVKGF